MPNDPNALVAMSHESSPDEEPAITTQAAFDQLWKAKGWKHEGTVDGTGNIVPASTPAATTPVTTPSYATPSQES